MLQNYSTFSARPERFSSVKKGLYSSPFGCELKGRNLKLTGVNKSFRFGFQGQEGDDEIKGDGNSYDFGARMLDPRLGRWFVADPLIRKQPSQSPYKAFFNSPMFFTDPDGETEWEIHIIINAETGEEKIKMKRVSSDVMTDGVKHTVWDSQASSHQENYYYDFARVTVEVYHKDGKPEVFTKDITFESKIIDRDYVLFGGDKKGDTHSEWNARDVGVEVAFGITLTGDSGADKSAIGQDWSKNAVGDANWENLTSILTKWSTSASKHKIGSGSWLGMKPKDFKSYLNKFKNSLETGEKIGKAVNKTKELIKANQDTDSCTACNKTGTAVDMKNDGYHVDIVKTKGNELKKK